MFAPVGRRLALLNVVVVVAVIAAIGLGTYVLLRRSLNAEANNALAERIGVARLAWTPELASGQLAATPATNQPPRDADDDDHDDHDDSDDILKSGDTLLFAFDGAGTLLANERGVSLSDVPVQAGVERALDGDIDTRIVQAHDERVRVRTEPVEVDGEVIGAIQAVRSEREHDGELRLIRNVSFAGIALGVAIALPAGLFLAHRAMRPIDAVFTRQRTFIADASHELRTPLTVLRANADMVRRLPAPSEQTVRHEMDQMMREIDTMNRLVDDLLELARLDNPDVPIATEPVDVAEVAHAAARAMQPQATQAGLSLTVNATPAFARANDALVEQVLRILLDNAIKYAAAGDAVTVTVAHRGHEVVASVRDTGAGIAAEELALVFDRFYRSDRARTRASGGSGLGLPIARSIVHALGGEIHLSSMPGEGTTVTFTLPAARGAHL
ncbi:MAG TPA: HAMP domain-containing sensor histidine kinase [Thermomicrobiales bacterium]|nr:HAMP domain-containing sensor histidine kinase [Thermomicrobiales bacterium]